MKTTTFIIGAGASTDFGMPLGSGLAAAIRERLVDELDNLDAQPILNSAMRTGRPGDYGKAAQDIAGGMIAARSIDRFIHSRQDDELVAVVGKRAIGAVLSTREAQSLLGSVDDANWRSIHEGLLRANASWLAVLFSLLQEGIRPTDAAEIFKNVRFIVFNYDRCIERYLHLAFMHMMRCTAEQANQLVDAIPIVHIYGSLGDLPPRANAVAYGKGEDHLGTIAESLRTFTESANEDVITKARNLIENSEAVAFLGFAFDPLNVSALFQQPLKCPWIATALGLGMPIMNDFKNNYCSDDAKAFQFMGNPAASIIATDQFKSIIGI